MVNERFFDLNKMENCGSILSGALRTILLRGRDARPGYRAMKAAFGLSGRYTRDRRAFCALIAGVASFASLCAVTPALATTLQCSPGQIVVGSPPTDPQYAVAGTTVEFGPAGWRIEHRLANGTIADRNSQYSMWDTSTSHSMQWRGRYTRNLNLFMIGEVVGSGIPHHLIYKEWLYDASKGNALIIFTLLRRRPQHSPRRHRNNSRSPN